MPVELRSCVKVEVAVLGSPSLMVLMVSVDVKQHLKRKIVLAWYAALVWVPISRRTLQLNSV